MKRVLLTNIRLKLLSLAFASALWFFVAGQSNTEVGFIVPISFKGVPKEMIMTSTPPGEVEVRVMGPKLFINNLSPSQIIAELDLSDGKEGLNTYKLSPKDIVTPMGVEVLRLRPNSVDVKMERLIKVNLPIKVRMNGRPESGFRVSGISVIPKAVIATGLKKDIKDLSGIYTRPVDVTGLRYSTTISAPLDVQDFEFRSISTDKADVRIIIKKER